MSDSRSILVWDFPTRLTHWLFVVCIGASWWTAEQRLMDWHRYSGYTMLGLLVFRIYWGLAGSTTARFARFLRGPRAVLDYFKLSRERRAHVIGHTPLGSWSVVALLLAMLVQVTLGLFATDIDGLESGPLSHLVSFDGGRAFAEAHELSFDVLIALAVVHVLAIVFYLFYDRNDLTSPMLSGRKRVAGDVAEVQQVSVWRLGTGVAIATLVVWVIIKG